MRRSFTGDICQTITEIAVKQHAPITVEEFHTLNRCLDTAIAEAVTEHTRLTTQRRSDEEVERLGQAAGKQRRERLNVTSSVDEIAATGMLHSEYRGIRFTVLPIDPALALDAIHSCWRRQ